MKRFKMLFSLLLTVVLVVTTAGGAFAAEDKMVYDRVLKVGNDYVSFNLRQLSVSKQELAQNLPGGWYYKYYQDLLAATGTEIVGFTVTEPTDFGANIQTPKPGAAKFYAGFDALLDALDNARKNDTTSFKEFGEIATFIPNIANQVINVPKEPVAGGEPGFEPKETVNGSGYGGSTPVEDTFNIAGFTFKSGGADVVPDAGTLNVNDTVITSSYPITSFPFEDKQLYTITFSIATDANTRSYTTEWTADASLVGQTIPLVATSVTTYKILGKLIDGTNPVGGFNLLTVPIKLFPAGTTDFTGAGVGGLTVSFTAGVGHTANYTISNVPTGSYIIYIAATGNYREDKSKTVTISNLNVTVGDITLANPLLPYTFKGRVEIATEDLAASPPVVAPTTWDTVEGLTVKLYEADVNAASGAFSKKSGTTPKTITTNAGGIYTFAGVNEGNYIAEVETTKDYTGGSVNISKAALTATDSATPARVLDWSGSAATAAQLISLTEEPGIFDVEGDLIFTALNSAGILVNKENIRVDIYESKIVNSVSVPDFDKGSKGHDLTDNAGHYKIEGLFDGGSVTTYFAYVAKSAGEYEASYSTTAFKITTGETLNNKDVTLTVPAKTSKIKGTLDLSAVVAANKNITVKLYEWNTTASAADYRTALDTATTEGTGYFEFPNSHPAASYVVRVEAVNDANNKYSELVSGSFAVTDDGAAVTVSSASDNLKLAPYTEKYTVSGVVTDNTTAGNVDRSKLIVRLTNSSNAAAVGKPAFVKADGTYEIKDVTPKTTGTAVYTASIVVDPATPDANKKYAAATARTPVTGNVPNLEIGLWDFYTATISGKVVIGTGADAPKNPPNSIRLVPVHLYGQATDANDAPVTVKRLTTYPDADGNFEFPHIAGKASPGKAYQVRIDPSYSTGTLGRYAGVITSNQNVISSAINLTSTPLTLKDPGNVVFISGSVIDSRASNAINPVGLTVTLYEYNNTTSTRGNALEQTTITASTVPGNTGSYSFEVARGTGYYQIVIDADATAAGAWGVSTAIVQVLGTETDLAIKNAPVLEIQARP